MPDDQYVDVDFEYDVTDASVVEQKARKLLGEGRHVTAVEGYREHEDRPGGYFRVWHRSWR